MYTLTKKLKGEKWFHRTLSTSESNFHDLMLLCTKKRKDTHNVNLQTQQLFLAYANDQRVRHSCANKNLEERTATGFGKYPKGLFSCDFGML